MKAFFYILGGILLLYSVFSALPFLQNASLLSDYGKGFIVGKLVLGLLGIGFILWAKRISFKRKQ